MCLRRMVTCCVSSIRKLLTFASRISIALRKPSNLLYSSYIGGCSELLAHIGAAKSDVLLPQFIRPQQLQEEIKLAFQYDNPNQNEQADADKIEALCHRFEQELEASRLPSQSDSWSNGLYSPDSGKHVLTRLQLDWFLSVMPSVFTQERLGSMLFRLFHSILLLQKALNARGIIHQYGTMHC